MMARMKKLAIVYHSQSGATATLAAAALAGAQGEEGVDVRWLRAWDADAGDVLDADAVLFACAENSGMIAGSFKDFLDRIYYPTLERTQGKPYALLVSAGSDGRNAVQQLQRILRGLAMKQVAEPCILRGEPNEAALDTSRELGAALAAGLSLGIF